MERFVSLVVSVLLCSACSNGWGSVKGRAKQMCSDTFEEWSHGGIELPERERFMAECVQPLAQALEPCTEHAFGTDSAVQCVARRTPSVIIAAGGRASE